MLGLKYSEFPLERMDRDEESGNGDSTPEAEFQFD
jgi:hypothetical protein